MKIKSLLLAAVAGVALNAGAVVQGTLTAENITITDENVGQPIMVAVSLSDLGTVTGEEAGYGKYEGEQFAIGAAKQWKNIQFNLTFPEGLRPVKVNMDDNDNYVLDSEEYNENGESTGWWDECGADITLIGPKTNKKPCVEYSSNFDNAEMYPNFKVVGANMSATLNPEGEVYIMFVAADEDMPNGTYDLKVYCKWIDQNDGDNTIFSDEERGVLCQVIVNRTEEPTTRLIQGLVIDENEAPLEGVTVTATAVTENPEGMLREPAELTTVTGADGSYSLEVPADGTYTLTFAKEGYVTKTVDEAEAETVQLELEQVVGVNDVNAAKAVASVKYYNAAGVASDNAFEGVNIVVTKYADGSKSVVKVVK